MNKREQIIRDIMEGIRSGKLVTDHKLPPERELAADLGVSRVLLREAIVALETLGVVEVKKRLGIFVREPELSGVAENLRVMPFWPENFVPQLMEMRLIIDVHAAEFAAMRRTEGQLAKLQECLDTLFRTPLSSPEGVRSHAHYEFLFHMLIVEAAHNDILTRVYEGLVSLMEKNNEILHRNLTRDADWASQVLEHHRKTLLAIRDKDPVKAAQGMRQHILDSIDMYQGMKEKGLFSYPGESAGK